MLLFTTLIIAYIIGYALALIGSIFITKSAFLLYRYTQHPSARAHIGLISISILLILSVVCELTLIFYVREDVRKIFPLFILPAAACILIGPLNGWTSPNEASRKSALWRTGSLLTIVGVTVLVVGSVVVSIFSK